MKHDIKVILLYETPSSPSTETLEIKKKEGIINDYDFLSLEEQKFIFVKVDYDSQQAVEKLLQDLGYRFKKQMSEHSLQVIFKKKANMDDELRKFIFKSLPSMVVFAG